METSLFRYIWQHSRKEQIFVLSLIAASLPFYWMSLDVPKRIVDGGLQGGAFIEGNTTATLFAISIPLPDFLGGGSIPVFEGVPFDQIGYLLALSFLFLFFVLCNGAFKYVINVRKGILAERMLRRMRFDLFTRLMQFRPERIRSVKPAEAASMINNEVEPISGFIGDAFILPAFLGSQALTALIFIVAQSMWLGMVALAVVLIQAFVIPILRRKLLILGRQRQIAARKFSGRIGEMVDQSRLIHVQGLQAYSKAEIGDRLGHLFDIREKIFRRKFAVKYLNNFLAQITPFFFYSIGGYLALTGSLEIGQLLAVIVAYRDLPPPIKELINWDQMRADVTIKYEQVLLQFEGGPQSILDGTIDTLPSSRSPLTIEALRITDQRGAPLLESFTAKIERPSHVALVGPSSSGRDLVAQALTRQLTSYDGRVRVGDIDIRSFNETAVARLVGHVPSDPILFAGSIRDNVTISLYRRMPHLTESEDRKRREALRSGNPTLDFSGDWIDYSSDEDPAPETLENRIIESLDLFGMAEELYAFGLQGRISEIGDPDIVERIIRARGEIRGRLGECELNELIEPFDLKTFNTQATLAENLVFGVVASERLAGRGLACDPYFRTIIAAEALEQPLIEIAVRVAETAIEVFAELPSGHPLLDRFSMIASSELDIYSELVERVRQGESALTGDDVERLITLALAYVEPRHRMGLVTPELEKRILRARESFRSYLPHEYEAEIEFYLNDRVMLAAPLRDNLLFGRVTKNIANAEKRVIDLMNVVLLELGLTEVVYKLGLDYDVGPKGRNMFAQQRAAIGLARNIIKAPEILILEDALKPFGQDQRRMILQRIRECLADRTLIVTVDEVSDAKNFDSIYVFEGIHGRREKQTAVPVNQEPETIEEPTRVEELQQ